MAGSRFVLDFTDAETKAIYAAGTREGHLGELATTWMKRVILERANSFNLTVRDPDAPTESWGEG